MNDGKKFALVTGGSGDIGAAICQQLAQQNLHVFVHTYQHTERGEALVNRLSESGGSAELLQFDLSNHQQTRSSLEKLLERSTIQIIVHAAGIHHDAPLAGMSAKQWHEVIDISLHGFYHVVQPLLLPMLRTRWGRIISISSISGIMGNRGQANYAAAKAGLHGATQSLALEVASRGVTANVVAPGIIDTSMLDKSFFTTDRIKQMIPMQRLGKPEEVAALVGFLASDQAAYISGQIIAVNGAIC